MPIKRLPAIVGMDNVREDAALERIGENSSLHVRDAVNIELSETGRINLRPGIQKQTDLPFKSLWQSPLHGDCFAILGQEWVKVELSDWSYEVLLSGVNLGSVQHLVLNNQILMSCDAGLFIYNGQDVKPYTITTPAKPYVKQTGAGSLQAGAYSFAVSWLVHGTESALSEIESVSCRSQDAVHIIFPYCMETHVTHVRLYMTEHGGSELRQVDDLPISTVEFDMTLQPNLGRVSSSQFLSPMPAGKHLNLWRGRLLTSHANIIHFSEPMTFHLMDVRYNFIQLPQRITFIQPVEGGLWVGQSDHVVFLRGTDLKGLVVEKKASARPIPNSSFLADNALIDVSLNEGGSFVAIWLSEKGFVLGTPSGQLIELQKNHLKNITAQTCTAVGFAGRVIAVVN